MNLILFFIAVGWLYVFYLIGKICISFIHGRNEPISIGRQPDVKATFFDRVLTLASFVSFIVIVTVFVELAYDLFTTQDRMIGAEFNLQRKLKPLTFLYGVWFAPASMVTVVYALNIVERFLGRAKSYPIELSMIPAAGYTIFAYLLLQEI